MKLFIVVKVGAIDAYLPTDILYAGTEREIALKLAADASEPSGPFESQMRKPSEGWGSKTCVMWGWAKGQINLACVEIHEREMEGTP